MVGRIVPLVLVLCAGSGPGITAQAIKPSFDVASIKPSGRPLGGGSLRFQAGGRLSAVNMSLSRLVEAAYGIQAPQLIGGPDWIRNDGFDVNAKAGNETTEAEIRLMLRALLEERFKLVLTAGRQEMAVQELLRLRDDGQLGPGLVKVGSASPEDCRAALPPRNEPAGSFAVSVRQCGTPGEILTRTNYLQFKALTVDKTELTGVWAVYLYFAPEGVTLPRGITVGANIPVFTTAIREQLGLRVRSTTAPMDVLRVRSVERPTPD